MAFCKESIAFILKLQKIYIKRPKLCRIMALWKIIKFCNKYIILREFYAISEVHLKNNAIELDDSCADEEDEKDCTEKEKSC